MRLDRTVARIRVRVPHEAIDLGFQLARAAGSALWKPWLTLAALVFATCNAVSWLAFDAYWPAWLLFWWFKPLLDRVPLFVASRFLFDALPTSATTLRAIPGLWLKALPGALLWRRFDFARALNLPVEQLEGVRGLPAIRRRRVLQSGVRSEGVWLTVACMHFEMVLMLSAVALLLMFVPFEFLPESFKAMWSVLIADNGLFSQFLLNLLAFAAVCVVEPFYVCGGFALYLNRRTELEGWDIEIGFRRFAARLAGAVNANAAGVVLAVLLALSPGISPAADTDAADNAPQPFIIESPVGDAALEAARTRVFEDEFLSPPVEDGHWRVREAEPEANLTFWPEWLRIPEWVMLGLAAIVALSGEAVFWILCIVLLAIAVHHRRNLLALLAALTSTLRIVRRSVATLDPATGKDRSREQRLPDDVATAVDALWLEGRHRDALALLYQASVHALSVLTGRPLPTGATEAECLQRARSVADEPRGVFSDIVRTWQYAAYAHRYPTDPSFRHLLEAWRRQFGGVE